MGSWDPKVLGELMLRPQRQIPVCSSAASPSSSSHPFLFFFFCQERILIISFWSEPLPFYTIAECLMLCHDVTWVSQLHLHTSSSMSQACTVLTHGRCGNTTIYGNGPEDCGGYIKHKAPLQISNYIEIYSACDRGILLSNTIAYCCVSVGVIFGN